MGCAKGIVKCHDSNLLEYNVGHTSLPSAHMCSESTALGFVSLFVCLSVLKLAWSKFIPSTNDTMHLTHASAPRVNQEWILTLKAFAVTNKNR